jgi:DNA (cytosine-5)-methyltransferase 1
MSDDRRAGVAVVDLFCGAGGASCGATLAGFPVALAVDACPHALAVHARNHPEATHLLLRLPPPDDDALQLPPAPRHVHASPPCQQVSKANRGATDADGALALVRWAVRFCRAHGTTWSLEQVGTPVVRAAMAAEGLREGVDFAVLDFVRLGLPQRRRRLVAGTPALVTALLRRAADAAPQRGVADVIPHCRGTHVRNRHAHHAVRLGGVTTYEPVRDDQSARPVAEPAYCVTGTSALKWWTPGDARCRVMTPAELAALQGFPPEYVHDPVRRRARLQIGNAFPPPVAALLLAEVARAAAANKTVEPLPKTYPHAPTPCVHNPCGR